MAKAKKTDTLSIEEKLNAALVPGDEHPYKVPKNWCWTFIGTVSKFERGITFPASAKEHEKTKNNIPCLRTANIQEELELDDLLYVDKSYMKGNNEKLVCKDDIIMSSANSRELVGKVSYVRYVNEPMTFGGFVLAIRANQIIPKYLFYYLRYEFLCGNFMGESTQTTNIANINTTVLGNYMIPIPHLAEQQRIVDRIESLFSQLDEARDKAQEAIDNYDDRISAILSKAFSGELTAKWRKKNKKLLSDWKEVLSQEVCDPITCGKTPKEYTSEGEIPFLKVYNIVDNMIDFDKTPQFIPKRIHEGILKSSRLKPHDVIMNIVGPPLRKIAIIPDEYTEWNMNQAIVRFRAHEDILDYKFLYYTLLNPETLDEVIQQTKGVVGQANISVTQSRNLKFILPSLDEQKEIVRILDLLLDREHEVLDISRIVLKNIEVIKKAILSKAFRGELGTNNKSEHAATELILKILREE